MDKTIHASETKYIKNQKKRMSFEGFSSENHHIYDLPCVFISVSQILFCTGMKHGVVPFPQIFLYGSIYFLKDFL